MTSTQVIRCHQTLRALFGGLNLTSSLLNPQKVRNMEIMQNPQPPGKTRIFDPRLIVLLDLFAILFGFLNRRAGQGQSPQG